MMKALSHRKQQKGAVLVLVTIALFTLLGFTALALDGGYLLLNKTRVQDAVDSAALSGARTLADGKSHADAEQAVIDTLTEVFTGSGFNNVNIDTSKLSSEVVVEFSDDPVPFVPGSVDGEYIRVTLDTVPVTQFFSQLLVDVWRVSAAGVAGTVYIDEPDPAGIVPLMLCAANFNDTTGNFGFDAYNGSDHGDILVIKAPSHDWSGSPGNFLALDFDGNGANDLAKFLAGDCLREDGTGGWVDHCNYDELDDIYTETGNMPNKVAWGINTRFNEYSGDLNKKKPGFTPTSPAAPYHPDCKQSTNSALSVNEDSFEQGGTSPYNYTKLKDSLVGVVGAGDGIQTYHEYSLGQETVHLDRDDPDFCVDNKRIIWVPTADCTGLSPGKSPADIELACMYLPQKVTKEKGAGNSQHILAEMLDSQYCPIRPGVVPVPGTDGFKKIVLFKHDKRGDA